MSTTDFLLFSSMVNYLLVWKMNSLRMVCEKKFSHFRYINSRFYCSSQTGCNKKGLLLGVYSDNPDQYVLTQAAERFNSSACFKLSALLDRFKIIPEEGKARIFYDVSPEYLAVCVVGLGKKNKPNDELEEINTEKECVRTAAAAGATALQSIGIKEIDVETFGDPEAAAEGVTLKLWKYDELRTKDKKVKPEVALYGTGCDTEIEQRYWNTGLIKAYAQNLARRLTDTPANLMTPTIFAENATTLFKGVNSVNVMVRDQKWAQKQGMNTFLSVSKGSCEPPVFLEIAYTGKCSDDTPVVLVGKGITFDTGGINIKPTSGLTDMRGDKGGAACVLATVYAISQLCLPINIIALIPLCENMPSGSANKPGDVITAMNGKTVRIDNTDAEGRLILADALTYAKNFNPKFVLDIATLTGAMSVALGGEATGVFTNSKCLWEEIHAAGMYTGDRVWRMPLWKGYTKGMSDHPSVDISNIRNIAGGGACSAAAFLKEFIPPVDWLHLDIAGVMGPTNQVPYLEKGMTGRPTRTLIQFLSCLR